MTALKLKKLTKQLTKYKKPWMQKNGRRAKGLSRKTGRESNTLE